MSKHRKRLLIIGAGSGGLIMLKSALEDCPDWEPVCMERSDDVAGCWGNPYPGFVSTTTRFATQFAAYACHDATMRPGDERHFKQFFRDGEYGAYLREFADAFDLRSHIRFHHRVIRCQRNEKESGWTVRFAVRTPMSDGHSESSQERTEHFDAVVVCTGLAAEPGKIEKPDDATGPRVDANSRNIEERVRDQTVVVCGGGESAVDTAWRLAKDSLGNRVYLSLRNGIRVSPRYHPIRHVPSDFLRNRLMLSIHPDLRNRLGDWFVRLRIRLEAFSRQTSPRQARRRRGWARRLHSAAREDLFDMFHNKSDAFLNDVARGRLRIIGPPIDNRWQTFEDFHHKDRRHQISADVIIPAIGFRPTLSSLFEPNITLSEFYLGCVHEDLDDLFAVGFTRPVIGNIPTISEMQAHWIAGLLSGKLRRPTEIAERNRIDRERIRLRYSTLRDRLDYVYPTEMFAYCDRLANLTGRYPSLQRCDSVRQWWRLQLTPASTLAYHLDVPGVRERLSGTPIHLPWPLIMILILLQPIDRLYRLAKRIYPTRQSMVQ